MLIIVIQIHSLLGGAVCSELVAPFHRNNHFVTISLNEGYNIIYV